MNKKPVVLMILDGYGLNKNCDHNAVCEAKTPVMDQLMSQCPFVEGQASGLFVGLPDGQMGNSEVPLPLGLFHSEEAASMASMKSLPGR